MEAKKFNFDINPTVNKKFEIKKKFHVDYIIGSNKKFEINDFKSKKRFIIMKEQHEQSKLWYQQKNSNDCGPCLLLNAANILEVDVPHKNILELREYINKIRREKGLDIKGINEWLSVNDLNEYFIKIMKFKVYPFILKDTETRFEEFKDNLKTPYEMIYFTGGSHFVGIIPEEQNYLYLDSFLKNPQIINESRLDQIINFNISNSSINRLNFGAIIRK